MCSEREFIFGITNIRKEEIHYYAWVSEIPGTDSLSDYVLVSRIFKERLLDIRLLKGRAGCLSGYCLVVATLKLKTKAVNIVGHRKEKIGEAKEGIEVG